MEEFDFDHARGLKRDQIAHLGTLDFVTGKENVVFLGPPGTGKTHLAIGLAIRACQAGHRVLFATASEWVDRLVTAHRTGNLQTELTKLGRYPLLVIDLCRHRDYAEATGSDHRIVRFRHLRLGIVTGFRGRRGLCPRGGSGLVALRRVWSGRGLSL